MWTGLIVIGVVVALLLVVRVVNGGIHRPRLGAAERRPEPPISQDGIR